MIAGVVGWAPDVLDAAWDLAADYPVQFGLAGLGLLAIAMAAKQQRYAVVMRARPGRWGIVDLELAAAPGSARAIKWAWGTEGGAAARASLWWDFGFAAAYAAFLAATCWVGSWAIDDAGWWAWLAVVARVTAVLQIVAGLVDAAENALLLEVLSTDEPSGVVTSWAAGLAVAKFALLALGVAVVVLGSSAALVNFSARIP